MRRCGYGLHTHGRPSLSFARSWRKHIEAPRPAILPDILQVTREAFPRNSKHRRRAAYFVDKILKVRNRATFRSSNPPNSGRSSISRPQRRSASIRTLFAVVRTSPELALRDIARSRMDFRFRRKCGHAADMTAIPRADMRGWGFN